MSNNRDGTPTEIPKPPRWTQVPNSMLDNLSAYSESEMKVYLAIIRAVVGYHRKEQKMTISYLMKITGLSKTSVVNAIASLLHRGLIARRKKDGAYYYWPVFRGD